MTRCKRECLHAVVPTAIASGDGDGGKGRVTGESREGDRVDTAVRPNGDADGVGPIVDVLKNSGISMLCPGVDGLDWDHNVGGAEALVKGSARPESVTSW